MLLQAAEAFIPKGSVHLLCPIGYLSGTPINPYIMVVPSNRELWQIRPAAVGCNIWSVARKAYLKASVINTVEYTKDGNNPRAQWQIELPQLRQGSRDLRFRNMRNHRLLRCEHRLGWVFADARDIHSPLCRSAFQLQPHIALLFKIAHAWPCFGCCLGCKKAVTPLSVLIARWTVVHKNSGDKGLGAINGVAMVTALAVCMPFALIPALLGAWEGLIPFAAYRGTTAIRKILTATGVQV